MDGKIGGDKEKRSFSGPMFFGNENMNLYKLYMYIIGKGMPNVGE